MRTTTNISQTVRLALALIPLALGGAAWAVPVRDGHVEAELLAESPTVQPGHPFTVGVRIAADAHWHTYWINPGDVGQATSIEWTLPHGFTAGPIQWPVPERIATGPIVNYGYEGEVMLLTQITPPADLPAGSSVHIGADVSWLSCSDQCLPGGASLSLDLPVSAEAVSVSPQLEALFAQARQRLPRQSAVEKSAHYSHTANDLTLSIPLESIGAPDLSDAYFFAASEGIIDSAASQVSALSDGLLTLKMKLAEGAELPSGPLDGVLVLGGPDTPAHAFHVSATFAPPHQNAVSDAGRFTMIGAILSAFLGGLILNLMPCVFPVLGVKILGFVNQAGADRRKITMHGLVFAAGVLISFWILAGLLVALRAGGEQLGWGFQLQSPAFVFGLTAFLLVFGLNLSGIFEFGLSATSVGGSLQMKSGYAGSFFTGVLVTVVSTPCAAPFLAPALGAALTMPAAQAFVLFTAIALGLSLPYLIFSAFPDLVKVLPRPGDWMVSFKQFMAFPLYATVAFLVWVLAGQVEDQTLFTSLIGLVLVAMGVWIYGRWAQNGRSGKRHIGLGLASLALAAGIFVGWPHTDQDELQWQRWSPEKPAALLAEGKTVYVDFTARWCATCKVNKIAVFSSDEVRKALTRDDIVLLKADWTNRDPEITRALARFGRSAVPVNVIYVPGRKEPILLPEVLTANTVLKALEEAKQQT